MPDLHVEFGSDGIGVNQRRGQKSLSCKIENMSSVTLSRFSVFAGVNNDQKNASKMRGNASGMEYGATPATMFTMFTIVELRN